MRPSMTANLHVDAVTFETAPPTPRWNALLAASEQDVIFLTRQYQEAWWHAFGKAGECCCCTLCILTLSEGGNLVGLAPFYLAPVEPADTREEAERQPGMARAQARAARQGGLVEPT